MSCPRCGAATPPDARFCPNCGNSLTTRPQEGERRVVTVLFCDVKGSTAIAESLDPEEWAEIMNGAFAVLLEPVTTYEGTVARLLGDAILAFFGAPVAHEDDPERAVLAALEMVARLGAYRERLRVERGIAEFDVRIGINTGLAVLGDVGAGARVEYTAMGDAVNVAARLQQAASPGTIVIGETTRKLVRGLFELRELGSLEVRGRTMPVEAYEVLGRKSAPAPRELGAPLVGRAAEMTALREAIEELRRGQGRVVVLLGEAGLGKSRLMKEAYAASQAREEEGRRERWSVSRAQSYDAGRSFHVFQQHVLNIAGASESDDADIVCGRIEALLGSEPEPAETRARSIAALEVFVGKPHGHAEVPYEGEALRRELVRLIGAVIRRHASATPAVFVFDDLQWSDPASGELLVELFALTDEVPVLFLLGFRPDRQSVAWRVKQRAETEYPHRYTELALRPLDTSESATLLAHLLGGAALPPRLRERVLEKAEGNPLFIEEIVRSLVDDGVLGRDPHLGWFVTRESAEVRIPTTVQGLVAARIDRLEEDARATLQAASVIGRAFPYRVLRAIEETNGKLDRSLAALQRVELIREVAREPERLFAFRHALTQEAAYGSILQRKRRELHGRVAETLEALFADRMEEYAALVGHHYAEAGDARAPRYLTAAGDRAMRLYALEDALAHYRRAKALAARDREDGSLLTSLYLNYGRVLELRGAYSEALAIYRELEALGIERGDRSIESAALGAQITVHTNPTPEQSTERASTLLKRAIALARQRGDRKALAGLLWNYAGLAGVWLGDPARSLAAGEESLAIARELGDRSQVAFTLNTLAHLYRELADTGKAMAAIEESLALFRELGNKPMTADCLSTIGIIRRAVADWDAVLRATDEAYRISEEIDNAWGRAYARYTSAYVHAERGDYGTALAQYEEMLRWAQKGGFIAAQIGPGADYGWLLVSIGAIDEGVAMIERALDVAKRSLHVWRPWPLAQLARAWVVRGDLARAREVLAEAEAQIGEADFARFYMPAYAGLARAELLLAERRPAEAAAVARERRARAVRAGLLLFTPEFGWLEGEALRRTGDLQAAAATLAAAREEAAARSRRMLWRVLSSLADLNDTRGERPTAEALRGEARAIVDSIARSLNDPGRETRFRSLPEVQHVLQPVPS